MMSTPNGTMISIVYKGGLPYIQHYYPTDKQMREITREEIMTSPGEWNPSLLDDALSASETSLKQFAPTPIEQTDMFYNMKVLSLFKRMILMKTNILLFMMHQVQAVVIIVVFTSLEQDMRRRRSAMVQRIIELSL